MCGERRPASEGFCVRAEEEEEEPHGVSFEIPVEYGREEEQEEGDKELPPSLSGDSSGEETYDDSIEVCLLLSLAISSSELEEE